MKHLLLPVLLACTVALHAEPEYPKMGPDIYDTQANGTTEVAAAVAQARAEGKNVLLTLGANWCIWCRRLHQTLKSDAKLRQVLDADYVSVLVDVNHRHGKNRNDDLNTRYGNPMQHGLPVLLVLDKHGKLLVTQETGALEDGKDAHDPAKVLAFLQQWAPKR